MVKLADIARETGVAVGTVSNALFGRGRISTRVREKIIRTAKEMGYEPNPAARILKNKAVVDIGLVSSDHNIFLYLPGFLDYCKEHSLRHQLELYSADSEHLPGLFAPGFAKGIIHIGFPSAAVSSFIRNNPEYPLVSVNEPAPFSVIPDFSIGTKEAIRHLVKLGHRRILMHYTKSPYIFDTQRRDAFFECLKTLPLDCSDGLEPFGIEWKNGAALPEIRAHFKKLLAGKNPPTAFFVNGINVARALIYDAMAAGLRIPRDFSVIAVSPDPHANDLVFCISTVSLDFKKGICSAIDLLRKRIDKIPVPEQKIIINTKIYRGETIAPPKTLNKRMKP